MRASRSSLGGLGAALLVACAALARAEEIAGLPVPEQADTRWRLAPVRWRGELALDSRRFNAEGQPRRSQQVLNGSLYGSSYIYQPWFAQLNAGLNGFTVDESGTGGSSGVGGSGMLSVFPTSRFPFQASFEQSDSRTSDQFAGQEYRARRSTLRQAYRNLLGDTTASGSFDRSTLDSSSFGRDTVDALDLNYAYRAGAHNVDGTGNHTSNTRSSGEEAQFSRLFGRHVFTSDGLLMTETMASYGESENRLASNGLAGGPRTDAFQLNSFTTWRPAEDHPLYLTGGGRYFESGTTDPLSETETRSLMAHLTANYRASANTLLNAGLSSTRTTGTAGEGTLNTQFAGANWLPDALRFGEYLYTANLGATLTNQSGTDQSGTDDSRRVLAGQASHGLQRQFTLSRAETLTFTASQGFSPSRDSEAGTLRTLTHHAGVSWRVARGDSLSGFAAATASDSHTQGYDESNFQLVNLQVSGQAQLSRYASLSANYTLQGIQQESQSSPSTGLNVSQNGGATYQHLRAFGVPALRYLAIYERSDYQLSSRAQGNVDAPLERVAWSFEQRLEYRIGKLEARLSLRFAEIDGRENALLYLRLARQFGDW